MYMFYAKLPCVLIVYLFYMLHWWYALKANFLFQDNKVLSYFLWPISCDLKWDENMGAAIKKAHQGLFFLKLMCVCARTRVRAC